MIVRASSRKVEIENLTAAFWIRSNSLRKSSCNLSTHFARFLPRPCASLRRTFLSPFIFLGDMQDVTSRCLRFPSTSSNKSRLFHNRVARIMSAAGELRNSNGNAFPVFEMICFPPLRVNVSIIHCNTWILQAMVRTFWVFFLTEEIWRLTGMLSVAVEFVGVSLDVCSVDLACSVVVWRRSAASAASSRRSIRIIHASNGDPDDIVD